MRLASLVDKGIIRRPHYVHEQELTDAQRTEIAAALQDWLRHPHSGSLEPDPGFDVSVAYHAGFLLAASWLLCSGTEAPELAAVFDRHRIDLHPDWWLSDGWGDYHDQHGVRCDGAGGCSGYTFALVTRAWLDRPEAAALRRVPRAPADPAPASGVSDGGCRCVLGGLFVRGLGNATADG